ncbi:ATP-binding protein [bacterium]|nr:ATP-binding protein [bacterium]
MLIEFRTMNHRSLLKEQVLTMESGLVDAADDPRLRHVKGYNKPLLTTAALYGANGSGKSNVLAAFKFMYEAVLLSQRFWNPDGGVPRDSFAWGSAKAEPSLFEISLLINGIQYRYGFLADDECILEEWLDAWPEGRKQMWFEREGEIFKFGKHFKGEKRLLEGVTRRNALFISAAVQHNNEQLLPVYLWFRRMHTINVAGEISPPVYYWNDQHFLKNIGLVSPNGHQLSLSEEDSNDFPFHPSFLDLLKAADLGIVEFKLEEAGEDRVRSIRPPRVLVRHRSSCEDAWLPFEEESQGTHMLFQLGPKLLNVLKEGGMLIVDELESSLHPLIALKVLQLFNDPQTNPKHAQIVFSTHDTNLLGTITGESILRRDQIWLTEKDSEGATCLYPLTDYKPRKGENLQRGYLQGRYGAIPFLGDLSKIPGLVDDDKNVS